MSRLNTTQEGKVSTTTENRQFSGDPNDFPRRASLSQERNALIKAHRIFLHHFNMFLVISGMVDVSEAF